MRTGKNFVYKVNKNLNNTVNQISDGKNVADNFLTASVLHCWSTLNDRKGEIERRNTMYPGLVLAWRKDTFLGFFKEHINTLGMTHTCIKGTSVDIATRRGTPGLPSLLTLQLSSLLAPVFTRLHHQPDEGMHPG